MQIKIHNKTNFKIKYLKKILKKLFDFEEEKKIIHLIFITPIKMQKMNFFYRKKNYTTDVLSFTQIEETDSLGDIFINLHQAQTQAKKHQYSFFQEVSFLAIHGYLHLKGYHHNTKDELEQMMHLQQTMLQKINLEIENIINSDKNDNNKS